MENDLLILETEKETMNFKSMLKLLFVIIGIIFINVQCRSGYDGLDQNTELALLLALKPDVFQVEANLTDSSGTALSDAMVYSSASTTTSGTSASVRATNTSTTSTGSTSTETTSTFDTSSQTDSSGKFTITLNVGDIELIITTKAGKSYKIKIKVKADEGFSYTGTVTTTSSDSGIKLIILKVTPLSKGTSLSKAKPFVCGYNASGDTAAPKITKIELTPETVSSGGADSTVTIKVTAEDESEGDDENKTPTGVKSITARLYSPSKTSDSGGTSTGAVLSLNSESGKYEGTATIKSYMENGVWALGSITTSDKVNSRTYQYVSSVSKTNYAFYGCGTYIDSKLPIPSVTIEGNNPDTTPPSIDSITSVTYTLANPSSSGTITTDTAIDISTQTTSPKAVTITITAVIKDNGGGSGMRYADARLYSLSRWNGNSYKGNSVYIRLSNTSGDTYSGSGTIKDYAEDGKWIVGGFWISDKAGNGKWYGRDSNSNPTNYKSYVSGGSTTESLTINSFVLSGAQTTANADFYSPVLKGLKIEKDSEDSLNFTATLTAEDTGSDEITDGSTPDTSKIAGITYIGVSLYSPLRLIDGISGNDPITLSSWTVKSGDKKTETVFTATSSFNAGNEGGTWKATIVDLSDDAGNYRRYSIEDGSATYMYPYTTESGSSVITEYKDSKVQVGTVEKN